MEADYAAKEVMQLGKQVAAYLETEPFTVDESGKVTMDAETWRELQSMGRASGIETEHPPKGMDKVTIEAPFLLVWIRLARCYLDGLEFGKRSEWG